jgi:membrane protease YdiL (CAAX protease family)
VIQSEWLPIPPEMTAEYQKLGEMLNTLGPWAALLFMAFVPAICEELFFRGYALSGLRSSLGKVATVLIVAAAFGVNHHSIFRLGVTCGLGLLFGLLVVQYRSIWPAMIAHFMHNGISVLAERDDVLKPWLTQMGFVESGMPPMLWLIGAAVVTAIGVILCVSGRAGEGESLVASTQ